MKLVCNSTSKISGDVCLLPCLQDTKIPRLTVTGEGEEMEIEVSDNPHDSTSLDVASAPIIITLTQVSHARGKGKCSVIPRNTGDRHLSSNVYKRSLLFCCHWPVPCTKATSN